MPDGPPKAHLRHTALADGVTTALGTTVVRTGHQLFLKDLHHLYQVEKLLINASNR
ncbi:MAG: hypothetical protein ACRDTG_21330 [Pseudonocardiaceae bacterium]